MQWSWGNTSSFLAIVWYLLRFVCFSSAICDPVLSKTTKVALIASFHSIFSALRTIFLSLKMGCVLSTVQFVGRLQACKGIIFEYLWFFFSLKQRWTGQVLLVEVHPPLLCVILQSDKDTGVASCQNQGPAEELSSLHRRHLWGEGRGVLVQDTYHTLLESAGCSRKASGIKKAIADGPRKHSKHNTGFFCFPLKVEALTSRETVLVSWVGKNLSQQRFWWAVSVWVEHAVGDYCGLIWEMISEIS